MNYHDYKIIKFLTVLLDLTLVSLAWIVAFYTRFYSFLPTMKGIPYWYLYLKLVPFIWVIWFLGFNLLGCYQRQVMQRHPIREGVNILQACIVATLMFISVTFFYDEYKYSRLTLVLFSLLHPPLVILGRSLLRKAVRFYRRRAVARKLLMVGSGQSLIAAFHLIKTRFFEPVDIIGTIIVGQDDDSDKALHFCKSQKITSFAMPSDWASFFSQMPCEIVVVALPNHQYNFLDEHLEKIAVQVTNIKMLPDLSKFTKFAVGVDLIEQVPVISIHESPLQGWGAILKRGLDIFGALAAIMLFGPLMLLIALLLRLHSQGPIFYRQERMGVDGKLFPIFKFRTMPVNVEKSSGAVWAAKNDQRATPLGALLRKTSLDELPQLFNVLKGDMSLVGPRPERPVFVNQFRHHVPGYMLRHKVKAGMTGWAQVNGWRGDTSIDKRIEFDLYYIQNWSLWLDIKILLMTVVKGFVHPNAY